MQRERPEKTAAGLLENDAHADRAESEAAVLARELRSPHAGAASFIAQSTHVKRFIALMRNHFIADERRDTITQRDEIGRQFEIHQRCRFSNTVAAPCPPPTHIVTTP